MVKQKAKVIANEDILHMRTVNEMKTKSKINIEPRSLQAIVQEKPLMIYRKEEKKSQWIIENNKKPHRFIEQKTNTQIYCGVFIALSKNCPVDKMHCLPRFDEWLSRIDASERKPNAWFNFCLYSNSMRTHFIIIIQCIVMIYVISAWCALNLYLEQYQLRERDTERRALGRSTDINFQLKQPKHENLPKLNQRFWFRLHWFDFDFDFEIEMVMRSRTRSVVWRSL